MNHLSRVWEKKLEEAGLGLNSGSEGQIPMGDENSLLKAAIGNKSGGNGHFCDMVFGQPGTVEHLDNVMVASAER